MLVWVELCHKSHDASKPIKLEQTSKLSDCSPKKKFPLKDLQTDFMLRSEFFCDTRR